MTAVDLFTPANEAVVFQGPDGEPFTTSMVIAANTGVQHKNVLEMVRANLADFEEFGRVAFETRPRLQGQHGGGDVTYALLNEMQATLLISYMRNSDIVRAFKKRLVAGFFAMRRQLAQLPDLSTAEGVAAMAAMFNDAARQLVAAETENKALTATIERNAPLVAKAEAHTAAAHAIHRQAFAREVQAWGAKAGVTITHEQVYALLRRKGMLIAGQRTDRNHATSEAIRNGWAFTHKDVAENGHAYATTKLNPRGQDVAWKWITEHVDVYGSLAGGVA